MKHLKMLGLATIAALALVGTGSASATVLCKTPLTSGCATSGWDYGVGTTFHFTTKAATTGVFETTGGVVLITCTGGTLHGSLSNTGGSASTASGLLSSWAWGTCSRATNTLTLGNIEIHHEAGTDNGTLTMTGGIQWTVNTIFGSCVFGTGEALDVGTITGGNPATINTGKAVVPKISGNAACPMHEVWNATYTITAPTPLYVSAS